MVEHTSARRALQLGRRIRGQVVRVDADVVIAAPRKILERTVVLAAIHVGGRQTRGLRARLARVAHDGEVRVDLARSEAARVSGEERGGRNANPGERRVGRGRSRGLAAGREKRGAEDGAAEQSGASY